MKESKCYSHATDLLEICIYYMHGLKINHSCYVTFQLDGLIHSQKYLELLKNSLSSIAHIFFR